MNWEKARDGAWAALAYGAIESTPNGIALAIIHAETVRLYVNTYQMNNHLDCRNVQTPTWKRLKQEWKRPLLATEWKRGAL